MAKRTFKTATKVAGKVKKVPKAALPKPAPKPPPPKLQPPQETPQPPEPIDIITGTIQQLLSAADENSVATRAEVGAQLIAGRAVLPHGRFLPWIAEKFSFSPSTAERHVALHHLRESHPALFDKLAPLGTTKAYFLVKRPVDVIEAIVSHTHVTDKGHEKAPAHLTMDELKALLGQNANPLTASERLLRTYRLQARALVRTIESLVKHPPAIADETLAHAHDALIDAIAELTHHFDLDD